MKKVVLLWSLLSILLLSSCDQLAKDICGTWERDVVVTYDDGTKEYRSVYDTFETDGNGNDFFSEYVFSSNNMEQATPEGHYDYFSVIKGRWKIEKGNLYKEYDISSLEVELGNGNRQYDKNSVYKSLFHHYKDLSEKSKSPLKDLRIANMEMSYDEGNIDRTVYKKANSIKTFIKPKKQKGIPLSSTDSDVPESTKSILTSRISEWDARNDYNLEYAVENLYANKVFFYGKSLSRDDIYRILVDLYSKYSDFSQRSHDIRFTAINSVTVKCDFTKTTISNGEEKNYPSYLYFQNINGVWRITQESDAVTDNNLSKRK